MQLNKKGLWQLLLLAVLMNFLVQLIHETGHWAVYQSYGRGPVWGFIGLVQLWDTTPLHPSEWVKTTSADGTQGWYRLASPVNGKVEEIISSAAGPVASLLGAVLGLLLLARSKNGAVKQMGLMFSLMTSFTMFLYYLRSPMRSGSDETAIAFQLGLSRSLIEIPFAVAFLVCLILGLRELDTWKTRVAWLAVILITSIPIGITLNVFDGYLRSQVDLDNPLFRSVFGFSLPVLLVNGLVLLGLWTWLRLAGRVSSTPQPAAG